LNRYEFLEILVRLAIVKYKENNICSSSVEALQKFLDENIYPNIEECNPILFRGKELYNNLISDIFK
jgi:hypothetical protein